MGSQMKLCMYCSRFETKVPSRLLSEHIGSYHTGYKPFHCGHCDWKTTTPTLMQLHIAGKHPGKGEIMVHHHWEVKEMYHRILFHTSNAFDLSYKTYLASNGVEEVIAAEAGAAIVESETQAMAGLDRSVPPTPAILHCSLCNTEGKVGYPTQPPEQTGHARYHLIKNGNRHPLPAGVEMMRRVCFPGGGEEEEVAEPGEVVEPGEEVLDVVGLDGGVGAEEGGIWTPRRSRELEGLDWASIQWDSQPIQQDETWGIQTRRIKSHNPPH